MKFRCGSPALQLLCLILFSALTTACTKGLSLLESWSEPSITSVSPQWLSLAGSETITVTGAGFRDGIKVYIGSDECRFVTVVSSSSLTCTTPAASLVSKSRVRIVNSDGQTAALENAVSYAIVLGQESFDVRTHRGLHLGMSGPSDLSFYKEPASPSTIKYMIVTDTENHRVLVWEKTAIATEAQLPNGLQSEAPTFVIGQPNPPATASDTLLSERKENYFGSGSLQSLSSPTAAYYDGDRLYVVDSGNHRVLVWNEMPSPSDSVRNPPADFVLGQARLDSDTTSTTAATQADRMNSPTKILVTATQLFVADTGNNRILVWNTKPSTDTVSADWALGQENLAVTTSNAANSVPSCEDLDATGVNSCGLSSPTGMALYSGNLVVSDTGNHRVMVWTGIPTSAVKAATYFLGQVDSNSNSAPPSAGQAVLLSPQGVAVSEAEDYLYVADTGFHRVLRFTVSTLASGVNADLVVGQNAVYTGGSANRGSTTTASGLDSPVQVALFDSRLFVVDRGNHRVLSWVTVPILGTTSANSVYGQYELTSNASRSSGQYVGSRGFSGPSGVAIVGSRLFVADEKNNRIMIWSALPEMNAPSSTYQLGQAQSWQNSFNNHSGSASCVSSAGINACTLNSPSHVSSDGTQLIITDKENHRVMIYSTLPAASITAASYVVGQADFVTKTMATASNSTLKDPESAVLSGTKLIVADTGNNRVLIWNTVPAANGVAASVVLGQSDFISTSAATSSTGMSGPSKIAVDSSGRLYVTDTGNNRVLIWNSIPTVNGQAADLVLGQTSMNLSTENAGGLSASSLSAPTGIFILGSRLYVVDRGNHRVLVWTSLPSVNKQAANLVIGQSSFTVGSANPSGVLADSLYDPYDVSADSSQVMISDQMNNRVLIIPAPE